MRKKARNLFTMFFLLSQNIFGLVNKLCEIGLPMEVIIIRIQILFGTKDFLTHVKFELFKNLKLVLLPGFLDHDQHCSLLIGRAPPWAAWDCLSCTNIFPPLPPPVTIFPLFLRIFAVFLRILGFFGEYLLFLKMNIFNYVQRKVEEERDFVLAGKTVQLKIIIL